MKRPRCDAQTGSVEITRRRWIQGTGALAAVAAAGAAPWAWTHLERF
jgi:hypothetical protein